MGQSLVEHCGGEGASREGGRREASGSAVPIAFAEQAWLGVAAVADGVAVAPFLPSLCSQR